MGVSSDKSCRSFGYPMLKIASCEQIAALLIPAGAGSLLVGQRHGVPDVPTRGCCRSKPSATRWFTQKSRVAELPEELLAALSRYHWPGTVRQLVALLDLEETGIRPGPAAPASVSLKELAASAAESTKKELVFRTLNEVNWNGKATARRLNILLQVASEISFTVGTRRSTPNRKARKECGSRFS
jgi:hypothetical protein